MLSGEKRCHLLQVIIRQMLHHIYHQWILLPSAIAKVDQLVIQISLGFSCNARIVSIVCCPPLLAMARHAWRNPLGDGVEVDNRFGCSRHASCNEKNENDMQP
jgi:hypothetical protein